MTILYHGTGMNCVIPIFANGFSPSSWGKAGPGVYVGPRAYACMHATRSQHPVMILCRVDLGVVYDASAGVPYPETEAYLAADSVLCDDDTYCVRNPARVDPLWAEPKP